jgi:hypothetical protein
MCREALRHRFRYRELQQSWKKAGAHKSAIGPLSWDKNYQLLFATAAFCKATSSLFGRWISVAFPSRADEKECARDPMNRRFQKARSFQLASMPEHSLPNERL